MWIGTVTSACLTAGRAAEMSGGTADCTPAKMLGLSADPAKRNAGRLHHVFTTKIKSELQDAKACFGQKWATTSLDFWQNPMNKVKVVGLRIFLPHKDPDGTIRAKSHLLAVQAFAPSKSTAPGPPLRYVVC